MSEKKQLREIYISVRKDKDSDELIKIPMREVSAEYDAAVEGMREVLRLAPVYVTPDGVWWNFRPDPKSDMGSCMIQVEGEAAKIVRNWHNQVSSALEAFDAAAKGLK